MKDRRKKKVIFQSFRNQYGPYWHNFEIRNKNYLRQIEKANLSAPLFQV